MIKFDYVTCFVIDFVPFAVEFVTFAIEFIAIAQEFVTTTLAAINQSLITRWTIFIMENTTWLYVKPFKIISLFVTNDEAHLRMLLKKV